MKNKESDLLYKTQCGAQITISEKRTKNIVDIERITHISCDAYLSTVYTIDNKNYMVAKLLKSFEIDLGEYGFIRANHNTIVNPVHIIEISGPPLRKLLLKNEFEVIISRRKMYLFRDFQL